MNNDTNLIHEREFRGSELLAKMADTRIIVCGAGAVGSLLVDNLVRQGMRNVVVIDFDRVEAHNTNTQLYGLCDVGVRKAEVLRNRVFRNVGVEIAAVTEKMTEQNASGLLSNVDVVVDAFDNSESRSVVQRYCETKRIACLHVGLFSDYCEIVWNEHYQVPRDVMGDVCEYPLARNIVMLAVAIASEEVVSSIAGQPRRNLSVTLGDLSVRELEIAV